MRRARGFTLIELLTVMVVGVILMMIAVPSFTRLIAGQRVKMAASNLQAALLVTRSEALKRNADIKIAPVTGTQWAQGWNVVNPTGGAVLETYPATKSITITGPDFVTYQSSGRISATASPTFKVTSTSTSDVRCVAINLTGLASVTTSGC